MYIYQYEYLYLYDSSGSQDEDMLDIDMMNIDVAEWKQDLIDPYIGTYMYMYIVVLNHIRSYIYNIIDIILI